MIFKAWHEGCEKDNSEEQICYLRLFQAKRDNGDVLLFLVDKYGDKLKNGLVLFFENQFRCIIATDNINQDAGIKTDFEGYAIIVTEKEANNFIEKLHSEVKSKEIESFLRHAMQEKEKEESTLQ